MSKENLFVPKVKNHVSRNAFDLSHRRIYSSKCGEILPCLVQDCLPGDKFKITAGTFSRTAPLNEAAFCRLKQYYNFYFVPYRLLYRDFPSFVVQQSKSSKAAVGINKDFTVQNTLPFVLEHTLSRILNSTAALGDKDSSEIGNNKKYKHIHTLTEPNNINPVGLHRLGQTRKLMQYLGYYKLTSNRLDVYSNNDREDVAYQANNTRINLFPLLAYQKVYNDFYRFSQWENEQANTYNVDYISSQSTLNIPVEQLFDTSKKDSWCFKSSDSNMFDMRYINFTKDTFLGVVPNSQFGARSTVSTLADERLFGQLYIQPNAAAQNGKPVVVSSENSDLGISNDGQTPKRTSFTLHKYGRTPYSQLSGDDFLFDVLTLRAAQAKQKFLEVTLSNNSDYKSQVEAHFNVNVSSLMSGLCDYIGGFSADLSLNTVTNTYLADDTKANYSATATMSGGGKIEFEAREHGVIIGVTYILPFVDYSALGYDPTVLRTSFDDFALPEYDRLGYEEVDPRLLIGDQFTPNSDGTSYALTHLGYGPRYYDYKTTYDICLGDFNVLQHGTQPNFVATLKPNLNLLAPPVNGTSVYKTDSSNGLISDLLDNNVTWRSFKVSPQILNSIFSVACGLRWVKSASATAGENAYYPIAEDDTSFDQFYTVIDYNITKISNLDRLGLPY